MAKYSRTKFFIAEQRGSSWTIAASTVMTADDINVTGRSFVIINGAFTLTLPAASSFLKGVSVLVHGNNANSKVDVAAGFGGGGASYDTVTVGAYNTVKFWCDGSYWYALSEAVGAS